MFRPLSPHPKTLPTSASAINVLVDSRPLGGLRLNWRLALPADRLKLSEAIAADRTNNLWQSTCFELFVRERGAAQYFEFNFSPWGAWAAYGFEDRREGMHDLPLVSSPLIEFEPFYDRSEDPENEIEIDVQLQLPEQLNEKFLRLGLSAVVEEIDGTKSYWALAHPDPEKPDFHHPDCFTLELSPPSAA